MVVGVGGVELLRPRPFTPRRMTQLGRKIPPASSQGNSAVRPAALRKIASRVRKVSCAGSNAGRRFLRCGGNCACGDAHLQRAGCLRSWPWGPAGAAETAEILPPSCLQVQPCGGDVVGTWTYLGGCISATALTAETAATCPDRRITGSNIAITGSATYRADLDVHVRPGANEHRSQAHSPFPAPPPRVAASSRRG